MTFSRSIQLPNQEFVLHRIGFIYQQIGKHKKAIVYLKQALKIYKENNDKKGECKVLIRLYINHFDIKDTINANKYLEKCKKYCKDVKL